jgi:TPR repeat protein
MTFAAGDYIWEEKFKKELPKAEQGDSDAQYAVGEMYEKGKGAVRDQQKAFEWYNKSADQGNVKAAYKLGLAYLKGNGVSKNYSKARSWLEKSANKDYVRAQYYLGEIYENGHGVSQDYDEAMKWYKRALKGGFGSASESIRRVARAQEREDEARSRRVAAARRAEAKAKPKPKPAPAKPNTPKDKVMAGGWKKRNNPAEYLPSNVTQCKDQGSRIECLSAELKRNIGMADINYTTKAILFGFKPNGSFKISYRNNVTKITVTDPDFAASGRKVPVTLGWQDADHQLECEFENDRTLSCTKNKLRSITLRR